MSKIFYYDLLIPKKDKFIVYDDFSLNNEEKIQEIKYNHQWFTLLNYIDFLDCLKLSNKKVRNYIINEEENRLIIYRLFSMTYKYISDYIDKEKYFHLCLDVYKYCEDIDTACNIIFYKLSLFLFSKNFIYTEKEIRSILLKIISKFGIYCLRNSIFNNPLTLEKIILFHNNISKKCLLSSVSKPYHSRENILLLR
jgi:hypothetical protein